MLSLEIRPQNLQSETLITIAFLIEWWAVKFILAYPYLQLSDILGQLFVPWKYFTVSQLWIFHVYGVDLWFKEPKIFWKSCILTME